MPTACAPTAGREASNTAIAGCTLAPVALAGAGESLVELVLTAEQAPARVRGSRRG